MVKSIEKKITPYFKLWFAFKVYFLKNCTIILHVGPINQHIGQIVRLSCVLSDTIDILFNLLEYLSNMNSESGNYCTKPIKYLIKGVSNFFKKLPKICHILPVPLWVQFSGTLFRPQCFKTIFKNKYWWIYFEVRLGSQNGPNIRQNLTRRAEIASNPVVEQ